MNAQQIASLNPGDRIWRWVHTGGGQHGPFEMTVVRVNPKTVTVDSANGRGRVPHEDIVDRADWKEAEQRT